MAETTEKPDPNSRSIVTAQGDLRLPVQLGHYRVYQKIGEGGMGQVYLAEDKALHRQVAVKTLAQNLATESSYVRRFLNEAQSIAQLSHPGIIQIYYIGRVGQVVFFAMEYVQGETVSARLKKAGRLDPVEALSIARQVAEALSCALEQGVIHRDIKPANLFIGPRGRVKVGDFGLAKSRHSDMSLTQAGSVMGSPYYISPEQGCGHPVDHRSDIYSLGATLYHLLAGRPPFAAPSAVEMVMRHVKDPLPPLDDLPPQWQEPVNALLGRMMAKKPEDRPPTYEDLVADLDAVCAQAGLSASALAQASEPTPVLTCVGVDGPDDGPAPRTRRGRLALFVLTVGLVLTVAVAAVVWRQVWPDGGATASPTSNGQVVGDPGAGATGADGAGDSGPAPDAGLDETAPTAAGLDETAPTTGGLASGDGAGTTGTLGMADGPARLPRLRDRQLRLLKEHFQDNLAEYQFLAIEARIGEYTRLAQTSEQMAALRTLRFQNGQLIDLKQAVIDRVNQGRGAIALELGPETRAVFLRADAAFLACRIEGPDGSVQRSRPWGELLTPEQFLRLGWGALPASPFKINALWAFASVYEIEEAYEGLWAAAGAAERADAPSPIAGGEE